MKPPQRILFALGCLSLATSGLAEEEPDPRELIEARKLHVDKALRALKPIQTKYFDALGQELQNADRSDDLAAIIQLKEEINRARDWTSLAKDREKKPYSDPELLTLFKQYHAAAEKSLFPIQVEYVAFLKKLQTRFSEAGLLEKTLAVKAELDRTGEWKSALASEGRRRYLSTLSEDEFVEWLMGKIFRFSGTFAKVTLKFEADHVLWAYGGKEFKYRYRIKSTRQLIISGNGKHEVKFADDLRSGTLTSSVGTYDLIIADW